MKNLLSRVLCIQFILLRVCTIVSLHFSVYVVIPSLLPRSFTTAPKHALTTTGVPSLTARCFLSQSVNLQVGFCIARLRLHGCLLGRSVSAPPAATNLEGLWRRCTVQLCCCGPQNCLLLVLVPFINAIYHTPFWTWIDLCCSRFILAVLLHVVLFSRLLFSRTPLL